MINNNTKESLKERLMPCGRKRRKHKMARHKRKKKLRKNRHKRNNWEIILNSSDSTEYLEKIAAIRIKIFNEMSKCVIGQQDIIEKFIIALICKGHCILHGLPGLAKTLIISALAKVLNIDFQRIQFTPDLMPSDIIGSEILEENESGRKSFKFIKGPIFSNIILADEINRTPPKTQSALLQAMQEYKVSVFGKTYDMDLPFFVLATQNPIELEGTYPLPEAQLDRFLFRIEISYPSQEEEIKIASKRNFYNFQDINSVIDKIELKKIQDFIEEIPISSKLIEFAVNIVKATRPEYSEIQDIKSYVRYGAGPRASQFLVISAKARAALYGKSGVTIDDIKDVVVPVLNHRIIMAYGAYSAGITSKGVIQKAIDYAEKKI